MPFKDPIKQKQAQHESYLRNKTKVTKTAMDRHNKAKKWFREEVLSKLKCSRCPENDPVCLEFHHLDPSKKDIAVGKLAYGYKKERLFNEIKKCVVLCSNCHKKEHGWKYN